MQLSYYIDFGSMTTTKQEISDWFDIGIEKGATHMIIVCDTFEYEDYPVYVMPYENVAGRKLEINGYNMQRVIEVYSMKLDKQMQMDENRAFHYD